MNKLSIFIVFLISIVIINSPLTAQNPTPPPPDPGGDPCSGGLHQACPQRGNEVKIRPGGRRLEAAPQALASPMPFWAVGHGDGDFSSNIYRFSLWGSLTEFVNYGEMGVVLFDIAVVDAAWGPFHVLSEQGVLYRYYPDTGALSYVGPTGHSLSSLEYCNGVLYGWGLGALVRINPNTAQTTVIGYPNWGSSGDLMCAWGGTLYGIARSSGASDVIVVFNTTYGLSAWTGITLPGKDFFGGEIDGEGRMFVGRQNGSQIQLYHVDLATNAVSLVGTYPTTLGLYGLTAAQIAW